MTFSPEWIAALPLPTGNSDKDALRSALIARTAFIIADSEDPTDLVETDSVTGAVIAVLIYRGRNFYLDLTDVTTIHDGLTCIVTAGGLRYKTDDTNYLGRAVASRTVTAQPSSPTVGDTYIVGDAATGTDWAGHDGDLAAFTAWGWLFKSATEGWLVWVTDEARHYVYKSGAWVAALSNVANSIPLSSAIAWGGIVSIVNQVTNTPPASPSVGDAYIVGSSPTGAWVGQSLKLAICETAGVFTLYTPWQGLRVHDRALKEDYQWSATESEWRTASGRFKVLIRQFGASGTYTPSDRLFGAIVTVVGGGGGYYRATPSPTAGGTTSFGVLLAASGGQPGSSTAGGAGGNGVSTGAFNVAGEKGGFAGTSGDLIMPGGSSPFGYAFGRGAPTSTDDLRGAGGGGGASRKFLTAGEIGGPLTVTVGAAGSPGGAAGGVEIVELILV